MSPMPTTPDYPRLPRSWKNRYPFRLACPSFVYPDDYDVNVDCLGPHVDEIELLFFEGRRESRPTSALVDRLVRLGKRHAVGYNVHLPTDLLLWDDDTLAVETAAGTIKTLTRILTPLNPRFYVLHLERPTSPAGSAGKRAWQACVTKGLKMLIAKGCPVRNFRVENQTAPLDWIAPLLEAFDMDLCLDIGHLQLAGEDLASTLSRWPKRIRALHIHGVSGGRDHRALSCLPIRDQVALTDFLKTFDGSVCVEVFGYQALCDSLLVLEEWMD
ncbi:MAG: cobamide remodeling phosphodiesterase CbiR [Desulfobacterales bacterium]|nr:cobamide remodeling phosphodiesterase CbiR [Desulfobacterales bacterium]